MPNTYSVRYAQKLKRRAAGLCVNCGIKADHKRYCPACAERQEKYNRRWRQRRAAQLKDYRDFIISSALPEAIVAASPPLPVAKAAEAEAIAVEMEKAKAEAQEIAKRAYAEALHKRHQEIMSRSLAKPVE